MYWEQERMSTKNKEIMVKAQQITQQQLYPLSFTPNKEETLNPLLPPIVYRLKYRPTGS